MKHDKSGMYCSSQRRKFSLSFTGHNEERWSFMHQIIGHNWIWIYYCGRHSFCGEFNYKKHLQQKKTINKVLLRCQIVHLSYWLLCIFPKLNIFCPPISPRVQMEQFSFPYFVVFGYFWPLDLCQTSVAGCIQEMLLFSYLLCRTFRSKSIPSQMKPFLT